MGVCLVCVLLLEMRGGMIGGGRGLQYARAAQDECSPRWQAVLGEGQGVLADGSSMVDCIARSWLSSSILLV